MSERGKSLDEFRRELSGDWRFRWWYRYWKLVDYLWWRPVYRLFRALDTPPDP